MTEYVVLHKDDADEGWVMLAGTWSARNPEAAMENVYGEIRTYDRAVAIPASAWHEFARTPSFKRVES